MVLLSRIPFMSHFLYEYDSVSYALAFQHFNISIYQPQAPGYIFFVALGKIVNLFFNNPNTSMIFISIVFSILTVILVYFLAKQMFSREIGVVACIFLIFNFVFWLYGETATIYMSESLFATLIAYTSYQLLKGNNRFLYISAIVLGLASGFRQDLIILMFPLWFFCLVYHDFDYKKLFKALIVLIASAMTWFIPTILLSGGLWNYLRLDHLQLIVYSIQSNSIFFGASLLNQLTMDNMLLIWTIFEIGVFSIVILIFYTYFNSKRIFRISNFKNPQIKFLILWIMPAFLFYLLLYIAKQGYTLVYLPVFALLVGYVIINLSSDLNKKFKILPKNYLAVLIVVFCALFSISTFFSLDYGSIQLEDSDFQYVNQSLLEFNPNNSIGFFINMEDWRKAMYYNPSYETYYSPNVLNSSSGTTLLTMEYYKDHQMNLFQGHNFVIHLNSSINNIIWMGAVDSEFYKQVKSKIGFNVIYLPDGNVICYSVIKNNTNITINNITFIKD